MDNYEVTNDLIEGFAVIRITEGEFKDVEFCYGAVAMEEKDDQLVLNYEHTIINGDVPNNSESFKKLTGDILVNLLEQQLDKEEVIYSGGSDEA